MHNARDFELIFLDTLKRALIQKFETAPKIDKEFLAEFVAKAGPVFIALNEFGKAFQKDGRGILEERELFLMICENIVLWQSILGVCMLVIGLSTITFSSVWTFDVEDRPLHFPMVRP